LKVWSPRLRAMERPAEDMVLSSQTRTWGTGWGFTVSLVGECEAV
jgi:hypothetical protein